MGDREKRIYSIFGIFAFIVVTVGSTYAFFNYSRTGTTTSTISTGDISFMFFDKKEVSVVDAYPLADSIGANDTANVYEFTVSGDSTGSKLSFDYTVTLLSSNSKVIKPNATQAELESGDYVRGYFTNDQIKVNLIKNDVNYILGGANTGVKLTDITGFNSGVINGNGVVTTQTVNSGDVDNYKLRIWISDDVNYTNTALTDDGTDVYNDAPTSNGKYNGYTYTLKVKIDSTANIRQN